jgi:uncharacterized protein (DUF302 family)
MTPDGMVIRASLYDAQETMERLVAAITGRGMVILARIDHAAAATQAGLTLRPTELVIFGNARAGTPLMQAAQTIGIDLPLKALVWQDESGRIWLAYYDPAWLGARHEVPAAAGPVIRAMIEALAAVASEASDAH